MKELLDNYGMFGTELKAVLSFYRGGTWTSEEAVQEVERLVVAKWVGKTEIAEVLFWALQSSVE